VTTVGQWIAIGALTWVAVGAAFALVLGPILRRLLRDQHRGAYACPCCHIVFTHGPGMAQHMLDQHPWECPRDPVDA
jgi:hypothetical protein